MNATKMAEFDIVKGFVTICQRINAVCIKNTLDIKPRLVAVSKTKPKEMIIVVYNQGQRHFGENYIQELVDKSNDSEILDKCKDIKWHFIGNLQRNKVNKLLSVPSLYLVETIDTEKLAAALNIACEKVNKPDTLKVMVQVNTSKEEEKGGCAMDSCSHLVEFILKNCPHLKFAGLMTIGRFGYDISEGPNPDFMCLTSCRDEVCEKLGLRKEDVDLSMGMSDDFEHAIELGSTNVRVGSSIFGYRANKSVDVKNVIEGVGNITVL